MRSKAATIALTCAFTLGSFALVGCGGGGSGDGDSKRLSQTVDASKNGVVSIALAENGGYVHVKGTLQFELVGSDSAGNQVPLTNKAIWTVSDPALGSINKNGLFTPAGTAGQFVVTAEYAGLSKTRSILITAEDLIGVTIQSAPTNIDVCKNATFTAKAHFVGGLTLDYPLTWGLVDAGSAELASFPDPNKAELATYKSGTVKIVASGKNNKGEMVNSDPTEILVNNNLTKVTLTADKGATTSGVRLVEGQIATITATGTYSNAPAAVITPNASLTVDKTELATIDSKTGVFTAKSGTYGGSTATVTGTCNDIAGTLAVAILKPAIKSIEIKAPTTTTTVTTPTVAEGKSLDLSITATFDDTTLTADTNYSTDVRWSIIKNQSGNFTDGLITINSDGLVSVSNDLNLIAAIDLTVEARIVNADGTIRKNTSGSELTDTLLISVTP